MKNEHTQFDESIGERIRKERQRQKLSQAVLAEKAGLSLPAISEIENGRTSMRLYTFARLIEVLSVSPDDILRLNTPAPTMNYPKELSDLFAGCSASECESILKVARETRVIIDNMKSQNL